MRNAFCFPLLAVLGCGQQAPSETTEVTAPSTDKAASESQVPAPKKSPSVVPVTAEMLENLSPWRNITDAQLQAELDAAYALAKKSDKRILLEFGADWCHDCVEVVKVIKREPAASIIRDKYVFVPINIGRKDRAKKWTKAYDVERIATLVVLEADGTRVAQSTLEPISRKQELTPEALAAWLEDPSDEASPLDDDPTQKAETSQKKGS